MGYAPTFLPQKQELSQSDCFCKNLPPGKSRPLEPGELGSHRGLSERRVLGGCGGVGVNDRWSVAGAGCTPVSEALRVGVQPGSAQAKELLPVTGLCEPHFPGGEGAPEASGGRGTGVPFPPGSQPSCQRVEHGEVGSGRGKPGAWAKRTHSLMGGTPVSPQFLFT